MKTSIYARTIPALRIAALLALAVCAGCVTAPFPIIRPVSKISLESQRKMRAEQYFLKGMAFEMQGLNQTALRCYENASALDPNSQALREMLIEKYLRSSKYADALVLVKGKKKPDQLTDTDKRFLANIYLRQGKFGASTATLESIKEKLPQEYYTLGFISESMGKNRQAAQWYEGYLTRKPESAQMWTRVAGLYANLKLYDKAESLYVAMERRFGQTPELLNGIGLLRLAKRDTAMAINSFKMAMLVDSGYDEAARNIAQLYIQKRKWDLALPYYEKLYRGDSSMAYGTLLALLYYYSNRLDKAGALCERLLAAGGDDYELHLYYGLVLAAQDSIAAARREFEKTVRRKNDFEEGWRQLCYLALKEKNFDLAIKTAEQFKTSMPKSSEAWRMAGSVYNARKEYEKAIPCLIKTLDIDSADAFAWFELGSSFERTKELEKAAAAFQRVLALKPGDPPAANYLGYMWAEQGIKLDSARTLLSLALAQDSLNGAYLDSYAWIYYKMGAIDTAYSYIIKALGKINDDPVVFSHYGDILMKKGDKPGALAAYKKGLSLAGSGSATSEEITDLKKKISAIETSSVSGQPQTAPAQKAAPE